MNKYEVKDQDGRSVGDEIINLHYGPLWKSALDRLNHDADGHLFNIHHKGLEFSIYRKLDA